MTLPSPFLGTEQPGLKRADLTSTVVSTSPATFTFTLPEQGVWIASVGCWWATQTNRGAMTAHVTWYQWNGTGGWLLGTRAVGSPVLLGTVTGMTLSDPTSAGVLTLTVTSSAGNAQVDAGLNLRLLSSAADQFAI